MTKPLVFTEPGGVVHVDGLRITMGSNALADHCGVDYGLIANT
jgi:hypothetical protein